MCALPMQRYTRSKGGEGEHACNIGHSRQGLASCVARAEQRLCRGTAYVPLYSYGGFLGSSIWRHSGSLVMRARAACADTCTIGQHPVSMSLLAHDHILHCVPVSRRCVIDRYGPFRLASDGAHLHMHLPRGCLFAYASVCSLDCDLM